MFRRHCLVVEFLTNRTVTEVDWILFLDADIGVINPEHMLEEYLIDDVSGTNIDADLIFHRRLFNGEIMAGTYFARFSVFIVLNPI